MATIFRHQKWANIIVWIVAFTALTTLTGWAFDIELFKRIFQDAVAMNPATAVAFLLSAFSFLLLNTPIRTKKRDIAGQAIAWAILLIGANVFLGYAFNFDIRVDRILFSAKLDIEVSSFPYNRMALSTSFCFMLAGVALLLLHRKLGNWVPTQNLAIVIAIFGLYSMMGYLHNVKDFYDSSHLITMAIHTAVCFFLLSIALLFAHPTEGIMATFTSPHAGGIVARKFTPPTILLPIIAAYLHDNVVNQSINPNYIFTIITVIAFIVGFLLIIYYHAISLNFWDIRRKNMEQELLESEARYRNLFNFAPYPMWIYDIESLKFLEVNQTAIKKYGYSLSEFLNMSLTDIRPAEEIPRLIKNVKKRTRKIERTSGWKHRLRDGRLIDVEITSQFITRNGREARLVIAQDITKRLRTAAQIQALNKELEAFTFSVAHDLRAPLRIIDGYTEIVKEDYANIMDEEGKRLLNIIGNNAKQMGSLIDDLLNLSRIGRLSMNFSINDINDLIQTVIMEQRILNQGRHINIHVANIKPAYCDGLLIKSVLTNLISNAIKYSKHQDVSTIHIGSYTSMGENIYFIKDNGVGFDMKYADKLFGVFQRLHKPTEFEGTGVGLAIVHRIITKHDGRVWAEAEENKGATFYFSLPLVNENQLLLT